MTGRESPAMSLYSSLNRPPPTPSTTFSNPRARTKIPEGSSNDWFVRVCIRLSGVLHWDLDSIGDAEVREVCLFGDTSVGLAVHCNALPQWVKRVNRSITDTHFRGTLLLVLLSAGSLLGDGYEPTGTSYSFCHAHNRTLYCEVLDAQFVLNNLKFTSGWNNLGF